MAEKSLWSMAVMKSNNNKKKRAVLEYPWTPTQLYIFYWFQMMYLSSQYLLTLLASFIDITMTTDGSFIEQVMSSFYVEGYKHISGTLKQHHRSQSIPPCEHLFQLIVPEWTDELLTYAFPLIVFAEVLFCTSENRLQQRKYLSVLLEISGKTPPDFCSVRAHIHLCVPNKKQDQQKLDHQLILAITRRNHVLHVPNICHPENCTRFTNQVPGIVYPLWDI